MTFASFSGSGAVTGMSCGCENVWTANDAAQAPFASELARDVAPDAADALSRMSYGAFLNVALATKERGPMPWDGVYAMATPGRAFDMFTNQAHALRRQGPRRPGGSLMLFAGGHGAAERARRTE